MGYTGQRTSSMVQDYHRTLEIVKRPPTHFWVPKSVVDVNAYLTEQGYDVSGSFKVLPRRWVVERTFAWINKYRRLSKDYEYLTDTSEATLFLAMSRTILKRLGKLILEV
jgi:putative transposase